MNQLHGVVKDKIGMNRDSTVTQVTMSKVFAVGDEIETRYKAGFPFAVVAIEKDCLRVLPLRRVEKRPVPVWYNVLERIVGDFSIISHRLRQGARLTGVLQEYGTSSSNEAQYWAVATKIHDHVTAAQRFVADGEEAHSALEGAMSQRLVWHRRRERELREKKLEGAVTLACEVCGFDFEDAYGELGQGVAEVHHDKPLSTYGKERRTELADLRILCSNCHTIIHRRREPFSIDDVRAALRER